MGGRDRLRRTAGVGIAPAEIVERYVDFFFAYLVALFEDGQRGLIGRPGEGGGGLVLCPDTSGVPSAMRAIDE